MEQTQVYKKSFDNTQHLQVSEECQGCRRRGVSSLWRHRKCPRHLTDIGRPEVGPERTALPLPAPEAADDGL